MCLLSVVSVCAFAGGLSYGRIGIEAGPKYNLVDAVQGRGDGTRPMRFHQFQIEEELVEKNCFSELFALAVKLSFIHDVASTNDLFDVMRQRTFLTFKVGPDFSFSNSWFVFADFIVGGAFYSDSFGSYLVLGADAGAGVWLIEAANGRFKGYLKAYFEYIRGSYSNEFGIGLGFGVSVGDSVKRAE